MAPRPCRRGVYVEGRFKSLRRANHGWWNGTARRVRMHEVDMHLGCNRMLRVGFGSMYHEQAIAMDVTGQHQPDICVFLLEFLEEPVPMLYERVIARLDSRWGAIGIYREDCSLVVS